MYICEIVSILSILKSLPISTGATYVRKYFDEESKKVAQNMANIIRDEFIKTLKELSWMDEQTRAEALKKANAVVLHVAYPDELIDNDKLEKYYQDLELQPNSLLHSVLNIRKFARNRTINQLRKPINKTDWETHSNAAVVNAYNALLENSIRMCDCNIFLLI